MKKLKLFLIGLSLITFSSFAFAMEKNPEKIASSDESEITSGDLESLLDFMDKTEIKLKNNRVEKINLTNDEENEIKDFINNNKRLLNKEQAKDELLKKIKEKLTEFLKENLNFEKDKEGNEKTDTFEIKLKANEKNPEKNPVEFNLIFKIIKTKKDEYMCTIKVKDLENETLFCVTKFIKKNDNVEKTSSNNSQEIESEDFFDEEDEINTNKINEKKGASVKFKLTKKEENEIIEFFSKNNNFSKEEEKKLLLGINNLLTTFQMEKDSFKNELAKNNKTIAAMFEDGNISVTMEYNKKENILTIMILDETNNAGIEIQKNLNK